MNFSHFLRIERDAEGRPSTHHVVHTHDPKFSLELLPDGRSVIVRSYSPLWDQSMVGADQYLEFELDVE